MSTVLVTGTSRGIGFETALAFARAGHTVLATMRRPDASPELAEAASAERLPLHISALDVDSDASVREAVRRFESDHGPVDVLVNNAGIAPHGTFEELPMETIRAAMETNYFGALRCIRAVLPGMRRRGGGCIVNVSSVAGRMACSPLGPYGASKAALEWMSEALAQEVRQFGIRVAVVEPGIIDTQAARDATVRPESGYPQPARLSGFFAASLRNPVGPAVVADAILDIVESGTETLRHPVGPDAGPFIGWRGSFSDEQWVAYWGEPDDETFYAAVERDLGLDARPGAQVMTNNNSGRDVRPVWVP